MVGGMYFPVEWVWADDYVSISLPARIGYYYVAMQLKKFFYFNAFSFTTGAIIASGLGYNGKDKEQRDKWDKIVSIYIWELETSTSPVEMLRYWNH